jgi:hypothetical protein
MAALLRVLEPSPTDHEAALVTTLDLDQCGPELDLIVDEVLASDTIIFGEVPDVWDCSEVLAHPDLCVGMEFDPKDADEDLVLKAAFEAIVLA